MQKNSSKKKMKIYAFIDSNNLYQGIKTDIKELHYQGWRIDFQKFRIYLANKYNVHKVYIFLGYIKGNENLYYKLRKYGYILIFKPTIPYTNSKGDNIIKGNVDAELVLNAMIEYSNYDNAIIVAGDGDYKCLIEYLEKKRKLGFIFIPNQKRYSSLLIPFRKYMRFMNPLKNKLEKK